MSRQTAPCDYCGQFPCPYWDLAIHPAKEGAVPEAAKTPCAHMEFDASAAVNRMEDTGRFSVDFRVTCKECAEPFRFLGVQAGSSPYEPKVSIDGLELRAPIEPQGTPKLFSGARFEIPPLPPRTDS